MDLFNKKKIKELENRISDLEAEDKSIWAYFEQENKKPKCFKTWDYFPEDSAILRILTDLKAIKDYLKIEIKWHWEDDPNYYPPQPKQIRIWRAEKIKR
jgi:hypothetical protein